MGVAPDFESDRGLRFAHAAMVADLYFVSNPEPSTVAATCRFRVTGKRPELWDPVTGEIRMASFPSGKRMAGRFSPWSLPPAVRFLSSSASATDRLAPRGRNSPDLDRRELTGPWTVHFDPDGADRVGVFQTLADWTSRPEPGIKYYSGSAVYTPNYDLHASGRPRRLFLDLGRVKSFAQVKVNGKDLGILWTPPFRVEITGACTPANALEVLVVNRWPNRMIGDQLLPPEKRYTSSTWSPFKKDSPLVESGLLGPVEVLQPHQ